MPKILSKKVFYKILENKVAEVSRIPRPSHHEKKICQFLMDFASSQGLNPVRDNSNNVMYEIPGLSLIL